MKKILLLSILFAFASCSSLGVEVKAQANTSYGAYTTSFLMAALMLQLTKI